MMIHLFCVCAVVLLNMCLLVSTPNHTPLEQGTFNLSTQYKVCFLTSIIGHHMLRKGHMPIQTSIPQYIGWHSGLRKTTWRPSQPLPQRNYNTSTIGWQYRFRKGHLPTSTSIPTSIHKLWDDNIDWGCTPVHPYLKTSIRLRLGFNTLFGACLDLIWSHPCIKEFWRDFTSILGWNDQI